jgi:hypothetical protein
MWPEHEILREEMEGGRQRVEPYVDVKLKGSERSQRSFREAEEAENVDELLCK